MTRLAARVNSVAEAEEAVARGVGIIDLSALHASACQAIRAVLPAGTAFCTATDVSGAAYVKTEGVAGKSVVAVTGTDAAGLAAARRARAVAALLVAPAAKPVLTAFTVPAIAGFIAACRAQKLEAWVGGRIEAPDIPRLLELAPDVIALDGPATDEITGLFRRSGPANVMPGAGDIIFVRDFVLPMEIGAYESEYNRSQRVRFNVRAEINRRPSAAQDMRDVFSYDIIIDAIRGLVARGHTKLVETLAEMIAEAVLRHGEVLSVMVRVEKLDLGPEAVGIEITRRRAGAGS